MRATLTSKGQITLPEEIRDCLQLVAGSTLSLELLPDNSILMRPIKADARRIRGLLRSPHARPLTVEEVDQGISDALQAKHRAADQP